MRFSDGFFNKNPIWTMLMSGFIGIGIYVIVSQEYFEDQSKFFYILIGLPLWIIIRQIYWKLKEKRDDYQFSTARELLNLDDTPERVIQVEEFNIFEENYKRSLIDDKRKGKINEGDFQKRVKALLIVGTEVEVGRELTNDEIDKLVGYEDHIQMIRVVRSLFDLLKEINY